MSLPDKLFFTGVPGSKWSGISQILESHSAFDTSDRTIEREYKHNEYSGHKGVYFGTGMEFPPDPTDVDRGWHEGVGTKIVKSHEWAHMLDVVKMTNPEDWIMLIYRPNEISWEWWHQAGGFDITYPNYDYYTDSEGMAKAIAEQNNNILKFAHKHNLKWSYFNSEWIKETFDIDVEVNQTYDDILVTVLK